MVARDPGDVKQSLAGLKTREIPHQVLFRMKSLAQLFLSAPTIYDTFADSFASSC